MTVICITGQTGSGKSRLLAEAQRHARISLFDCLKLDASSWSAPDPLACDAVAIDHVHSRGSNPLVEQAAAWCQQYSKPLWLADILRSDLDATGVCSARDAVEFNLSNLNFNRREIPSLSADLWHLVPVYQSLVALSAASKGQGTGAGETEPMPNDGAEKAAH